MKIKEHDYLFLPRGSRWHREGTRHDKWVYTRCGLMAEIDKVTLLTTDFSVDEICGNCRRTFWIGD